MLALALVLRLAWAVPAPVDEARSFAAAFGDHALCLSAGSDDATPAGPLGDVPAWPGGHAGHESLNCCQWHAAGSIILPSSGAATLIAFAMPADRFIEAKTPPPRRSPGRAQARAPPSAAS
jgi:hypothetical protein